MSMMGCSKISRLVMHATNRIHAKYICALSNMSYYDMLCYNVTNWWPVARELENLFNSATRVRTVMERFHWYG